jgi:phage terminase large subunit-like protein
VYHGGDPVLEWQAKNMALYRNHKDHVMPMKGDEKHKVDGMVSMLMAFSECMYAARKPSGSMVVF